MAINNNCKYKKIIIEQINLVLPQSIVQRILICVYKMIDVSKDSLGFYVNNVITRMDFLKWTKQIVLNAVLINYRLF